MDHNYIFIDFIFFFKSVGIENLLLEIFTRGTYSVPSQEQPIFVDRSSTKDERPVTLKKGLGWKERRLVKV